MPASSVRVPDRVAPPLKPEPAHAEAAIARMVGGEPCRRTVLAGLSAPALAAAFPAMAGGAHPDAELLELERRHSRAAEEAKAASARCRAIDAANPYPRSPDALFARAEDHRFGFLRFTIEREGDGRRWYLVGSPDSRCMPRKLRGRQMRRQTCAPRPEEGHTSDVFEIENIVPWPEAQARADEIVAAWDSWQAEMDRIRLASGIDEAERVYDALDDARIEIKVQIREATARTLDGLRIKARLAAVDLDEEQELDADLIAGLVRDLLAMGQAA